MASRRQSGLREVGVVLEDIRAQNKVVLEAVQGLGHEFKRDIATLQVELVQRIERLEDAVRENSREIRAIKEALASKVDAASLAALELRVAALERRVGGQRSRR
jgi:hypothetical protein